MIKFFSTRAKLALAALTAAPLSFATYFVAKAEVPADIAALTATGTASVLQAREAGTAAIGAWLPDLVLVIVAVAILFLIFRLIRKALGGR